MKRCFDDCEALDDPDARCTCEEREREAYDREMNSRIDRDREGD